MHQFPRGPRETAERRGRYPAGDAPCERGRDDLLRDPIQKSRGGDLDLLALPNLPDLEYQPLKTVRARLERKTLAAAWPQKGVVS